MTTTLSLIYNMIQVYNKGHKGIGGENARVIVCHPDDEYMCRLASKEFGLFCVTRADTPKGRIFLMEQIPSA